MSEKLEPPLKKPRTACGRGWLHFLDDHAFESFTAEWDSVNRQRISCNPLYLCTRTENVLLEVLLEILTKGNGPDNLYAAVKKDEFRMRYRNQLAAAVRGLLINSSNVRIYMAIMQRIGIREHHERVALRKKLKIL